MNSRDCSFGMELFDCNCWFGVPAIPPLRFASTADELLREMSFYGVTKALVYHIAMKEDSPVVGNELVIDETRGKPEFSAIWAILPPQTGEIGTPDAFVARMKENGVRALCAFPRQHKYLLNGNTFGALFEVMIQMKIPLILDGDWNLITELLQEFPRLTVVANPTSSWGQDRSFRPLIEKYPNFYITTTRYELDGGIKAFCDRYGPERMLFGTGFPELNMGGPVLTLLCADIPDEYKIAIGSGNLTRLLGEVFTK